MKPSGKSFFVSEQRKPLHRSTVNLALRKYNPILAKFRAALVRCTASALSVLGINGT
jgi:hypothetical protein